MLRVVQDAGYSGTHAIEGAIHMVLDVARTVEGYEQHADLAGWIETSRVAPLLLSPEEELCL
jgi:hypothetical protein